MSKSVLNDSQKRELIFKYENEVAKLQFQMEQMTRILTDLKKENEGQAKKSSPRGKSSQQTVKTEPKRRGRPAKAKTEAPAAEPKRRGRPRKKVSVLEVSLAKELKNNASTPEAKGKRQRVVENGYKLSEWDQFVIDALNTKQHVLITKDLIDMSKEKSEKEGKSFEEALVKNKLNRSLHKMTNKRKDLIKTKFEVKGFA